MSKLKILVVDDEPGIRSGIIRILKNFKVDYAFMEENIGFDIIEAETGEIGIEMINNEKPDIVLLDNKLPGMQGVEVLDYINENKINTIVVMITSYASLDIAVRATKNGAYDFIPKPFTPQELKYSIESIAKHIFIKKMSDTLSLGQKQMRYDFIKALSLELKKPIAKIDEDINIIENKIYGDNINDYEKNIKSITLNFKNLKNFINDFSDLTQLETGMYNRVIKTHDIIKIAKKSIEKIKKPAHEKGIEIVFEAPEKILHNVYDAEVETVFDNLLSNALKYNLENGKIEFKITDFDDIIKITISDTGIGMEKSDITKLFNEFVRIKNEKTKDIIGNGLGLSIVKRITELYKGEINVYSNIGKGTTFIITLPKNI
ncbi:MAG: response regulator [Bacteroidales bacterium]|nr:response regulator [Bacteroidales bacterium]